MGEPSSFDQGRYRVLREIGRGGMAVIYLALDEKLKRHVVIKVPLPNLLQSANVRARFQNEWRIGTRLGHPYATLVYDIGEDPDSDSTIPFIVMEYIEGLDVEACLERHGPIPARAASRITVMILLCLNVLHAQRVIHRDIKPANIRLRFVDGVPKLMDFGVAHVISVSGHTVLRAGLTRVGGLIGTHGYMPLEQMAGEALDERADLYAVATMLYVMLTAEAPPSMYDLATDDPRLARVPELLRPIILGATRAQRSDRAFLNADQMLQAIEAAIARMPPDESAAFYLWLREQGEQTPAAEPRATIVPDLPALKVEEVDEDNGRGAHTTSGRWFEEANPPTRPPTSLPFDQPRRWLKWPAAALACAIVGGIGFLTARMWPPDDAPQTEAITSAVDPPIPESKLTSLPTESDPAPPPTEPTTTMSAASPRVRPKATMPSQDTQAMVETEHAPLMPPKTEPTGTFRVKGDVDHARLKGRGGTHGPGEVPPGTYTLEASFDEGASFVDFGSFTVATDGTLTIDCRRDFGSCRKVE